MRDDLGQTITVDGIRYPSRGTAAIVLEDDDATSRPHALDESSEYSAGIPDEMQRVRHEHPIEKMLAETW